MIPIILIFLLLVVVLVITFIKLSTPKKVTKVQSPINKEATKLIEQAHAEKDAGNLQAYLNILSQANLKDPHNNEIKIELADAYNDAGLFSKAKLGYENYLKTEQNETNILEVLKKIFTIEDDAGNTRNVFLTALKIIVLNPADKNYYNILGLILGAHGKHDDAIGYLNKVIEMDPKDKKAYFYRGLVFAAREWKNEAAKEFEMAVNNGCEDVRASFLCGLMIRDTDKEKAIEYYLKAFDMMQKILTSEGTVIMKSIIFCGIEFIMLQQYGEAIRILRKIEDVHVNDVIIKRDFYYHLGYAYFMLGERDKAIVEWNALISNDETFTDELDMLKYNHDGAAQKLEDKWYSRIKELKFNYFEGLVAKRFSLNLPDCLEKVKEWFANIESGVVDISDMKKDSVGRVTSKTVKKLNVKEFKKVTEQLIGKLGYKSGKFMKSVGKDELFYYAKEKKMFGKQIIVTFKRWNSPIGELAIEDFCQILAEEKLKKGVLISNSEINDDARKLAAKSGIMTVDDVGIDKLLSI